LLAEISKVENWTIIGASCLRGHDKKLKMEQPTVRIIIYSN